MADKLNVDLEEIVLNKLEKNRQKYPVEKSKGSSKKYNEFWLYIKKNNLYSVKLDLIEDKLKQENST